MARILIVDDNAMNRQLLVEKLSGRGFVLEVAVDGDQALAEIGRNSYDLILLDINMPGVDGLTVLVEVRRRWSLAELPVIMTTARTDRADIVQALEIGANDYVTKPIDLAVLLARVRTHLALKDANDRVKQAQKTIHELTSSAADASHDVERWSQRLAVELSDLLGNPLHIRLDGASPADVSSTHAFSTAAPAPGEGDHYTVPIRSGAGRHFGEVLVANPASGVQERLLVDSLATQLAAALEMRELRRDLTAARQQSNGRRQRLIADGALLLHVCTICGRCYEHTTTHCPHDNRPLDGGVVLPVLIADRYRLRRRIAVGSTARLFAARDERLQRDVVLKIIKSECFEDAEMRTRFEREASAAARVDHPGVSTVHDSGALDDGSLFFVMEHLRGLDLAQMLRSHGKGAPRQVASLVRQIGSALGAVHKAGFIHRDVKPRNIFIVETAEDFRAKLLDFGIAKRISGDVTLTRVGTFIGTPAYMAPEQISNGTVDTRTDLYCFAASVYEALAGQRVVRSHEMANVFADILQETPTPISELIPGADSRLDDLFNSALAKQKEDRPATVEHWSHDVAGLLDRIETGERGWPQQFAIDLEE